MKFAVSLNSNDSISDAAKKSLELENRGIDYIWVSDLPNQRYAPAVCAAIANATKKIKIGLGLISPFLHTSQQIASSLTTLIESYGPRFELCIGPGDKDELRRVGVDISMHKKISISLLNSREEISSLLQKRDINCKIWLGAQGPKLLKLASSFEGILLNYSSLEMIKWALDIIKKEVFEKPSSIGVFSPSYVYEKIDPKIYKMLKYASAIVALGTSQTVLKEFSIYEDLEPAKREYKSKSIDELILQSIPQNVIKKFSIFMPQDELPYYVQELKKLGVEHLAFSYPQGISFETIRELSEALSRL